MQIELTILIPVYNEVNLLEKLVKNMLNTFLLINQGKYNN